MGVFVADIQGVPSLDLIEDEITSGLKNEAERMDDALRADDYYRGLNEQYLEKRVDESDQQFKARPKRTSRFAYEVSRLLSNQLWPTHPQREVEGDTVLSAWYSAIVADVKADVRLVSADRASVLGHVAAIELEATGQPDRPLCWWVWRPHEFCVWIQDDDPTRPWAVATRSKVKAGSKWRTRIRAWSSVERRTYYSRPYGFGEPSAGRVVYYDASESGPSPYPGVLPFSFVRYEPAVCEFWEGGLGQTLVDCNAEIDRSMSDLAQHVQVFLNPAKWARGMPIEAQLRVDPDNFVHLPADPMARVGDMRITPEIGYLQAQLAVDSAWNDLRNYVDQTLEELGVPATIVRTASSSTDLSGVALVAKAIPFYEGARARQPNANEIETDLFARSCAVVGLLHNEASLLAAAADPKLVVTWPEPKVPMPTADRDTADQWELDQGLTDPIEVLARRRGITIAQAREVAKDIAERRAEWARLMGVEMSMGGGSGGQGGPGSDVAGGDVPPDEAPEDEMDNVE